MCGGGGLMTVDQQDPARGYRAGLDVADVHVQRLRSAPHDGAPAVAVHQDQREGLGTGDVLAGRQIHTLLDEARTRQPPTVVCAEPSDVPRAPPESGAGSHCRGRLTARAFNERRQVLLGVRFGIPPDHGDQVDSVETEADDIDPMGNHPA